LEIGQAAVDPGPLLEYLGSDPDTLTRLRIGTLGVCFTVGGAGRRACFLKSHATLAGRRALDKEISLFQMAYPRVRVDRFECSDRLWMVADVLSTPIVAPGVADMLATISQYEARLSSDACVSCLAPGDDMQALLCEAEEALARLASSSHIGTAVARQATLHLHRLKQVVPSMSPVVCHGDLGPANLMCDAEGLIAVDWEDAFLGVAGYDFLYWLTFFDNRKYLGEQIFGRTPWTKEIDVALITMILLLKCELSVRAGRLMGNVLSFDQRLGEIFVLV